MFTIYALKHQLFTIVAFTTVTIAMCSCDHKDLDSVLDDADDSDEVTMTLDLDIGKALSRVSDNLVDLTGVGTADENYVDPNSVHVYLADESSYAQFGGMIKFELAVKSFERVDNTTYRLRCTATSLPTTSNFRVVVTANWQYTPVSNSTIFVMCASNGCDFPYNYGTADAMYYDPAVTPIPMFGVKKYALADYAGSNEIYVGSISLIRAMAKIVVESTEGDEIESATLTRCLNVGMGGPCGIYNDSRTEAINPSSTDNLNIPGKTSSRYNKGKKTLTNLPFRNMGNNIFVIYIPGYDNVNDGASAITLRMAGRDKDYTLNFTDDAGNTFNLCRNYMYVYDVFIDRSQLRYTVTAVDDYRSADIIFT